MKPRAIKLVFTLVLALCVSGCTELMPYQQPRPASIPITSPGGTQTYSAGVCNVKVVSHLSGWSSVYAVDHRPFNTLNNSGREQFVVTPGMHTLAFNFQNADNTIEHSFSFPEAGNYIIHVDLTGTAYRQFSVGFRLEKQ